MDRTAAYTYRQFILYTGTHIVKKISTQKITLGEKVCTNICASVHTHERTHTPEHKTKETVTPSITLNLAGLEQSDKRSCHLRVKVGGYLNPRLLPVFSFNLWRKQQHHNKHECTFYLFTLTSGPYYWIPLWHSAHSHTHTHTHTEAPVVRPAALLLGCGNPL